MDRSLRGGTSSVTGLEQATTWRCGEIPSKSYADSEADPDTGVTTSTILVELTEMEAVTERWNILPTAQHVIESYCSRKVR